MDARDLTPAAIEVLACLTIQCSEKDTGAKLDALAWDICHIPMYGYDHAREDPGVSPNRVVSRAIEEIRRYFRTRGEAYRIDVIREKTSSAKHGQTVKGYVVSVSAKRFIEHLLGVRNTIETGVSEPGPA